MFTLSNRANELIEISKELVALQKRLIESSPLESCRTQITNILARSEEERKDDVRDSFMPIQDYISRALQFELDEAVLKALE